MPQLYQVLKVTREIVDQLDHLDEMVKMAYLVQQETLAHPAQLETRVNLVLQVLTVRLVLQVIKVPKETKVYKDQKEIWDPKVRKVWLALLGTKDLVVMMEHLV